MKKMFVVLLLSVLLMLPVSADGNVSYDGSGFIFEPGSNESVTDLFTEFKDVMPGDVLTQKITVRNDEKDDVKVKVYLRSLGAHDDSVDFLSQLKLKVSLSEDNTMGYMFDANADQTDGLNEWVLLGTLYSGGKVNLDVTLEVPVELGPEHMSSIGYLDWEFMIEEYPVDKTDPKPPLTSDESNILLYGGAMGVSALLIVVLLLLKKKKEDAHEDEE